MKNISIKTLVITVCMAVTMTQAFAQATETSVEADLVVKNIWETEQVNTQNKEDLIAYNAWESQVNEEAEVVAMGEYTPIAYAADDAQAEADALIKSIWAMNTNLATEVDKVAKTAWNTQEEINAATEDNTAKLAWESQVKEEIETVAMGEYTLVACAADEVENSSTDSLVKSIWGRSTNLISKEDEITKAIW